MEKAEKKTRCSKIKEFKKNFRYANGSSLYTVERKKESLLCKKSFITEGNKQKI
jgi:hypothetical protein